jgi:hypothetical protein
MIIFASAVALATVQPAVKVPAAPSAHSEAMAHHGRHCCCCDEGGLNREGRAEHMHYGAEQSGHQHR